MKEALSKLMGFVIETVKRGHGIEIKLKEVNNGHLFPEVDVDRAIIKYNPKLATLLCLYDYTLQADNAPRELISHFSMYNAYLDHDDYQKAEEHLNRLTEKMNTLDMGKDRWDYPIDLQQIFILLHETYHILFHKDPKMKENVMSIVRKRVQELKLDNEKLNTPEFTAKSNREVLKQMKTLIPSEWPEELKAELAMGMDKQMPDNISKILDFSVFDTEIGHHMMEEYACDLYAWSFLSEQFKMQKMPAETVLAGFVWIFMTLNIMDYDKFLKTLYKDQCHEKMIMNPQSAVLRHMFLRSYIDIFYREAEHDMFKEFRQMTEGFEDRARTALIEDIHMFPDDLMALKNESFKMLDNAEIIRLNALYKDLEDRLDC